MMTNKALQMVAAVLITLCVGQAVSAQWNQGRTGRWEYLGEANVDGSTDHDRIKVGRSDGRFRAIRIQVERAPIEFQRVVIHYANGEDEVLPVRDRIRAGGQSRVIDLRGRDRAIDSVEFWYARANYRSQKPKLRLYGR
jgi:hypothetical protein